MTDLTARPALVIGTAGHIDHGKSTLVRALTGIDPDRLAEEKARGMTIDLGFAWMETPSGKSISIVDVPGHERFIKNMLAGVGGIDAAVLVIAADEGPMPQTDEHLAILDLLQVPRGLIALTKCDLVDEDWLELITEEVRERVAGTVLADAPIVRVSATTGAGLPGLVEELDRLLDGIERAGNSGVPRLPIDRVFTVAGFGTVVTGTLIGGELHVGQELRVMPRRQVTRIRGLQSHARKIDRTPAGVRVAVNVAGLAVDDLRRGDVLTAPGALTPSQRVDVRLRLLPDAPIALEQNTAIDFFTGAAELPGWLTLLDRERIEPGDTAWVQVRFREPIAALRGDRFIIRRPSPSVTIGGGEIIDPSPPRHKRFRSEVLDALETLAQGTPDELVLQAIEREPVERKGLTARLPAGLTPDQVMEALELLVAEGDMVVLGDPSAPKPGDLLMSISTWLTFAEQTRVTLQGFHAANKLRKGMPREELKRRVKIGGPPRLFDELVKHAAGAGVMVDDGATIRLPDFTIELDAARKVLADRFVSALAAVPFAPPSPAESGIDADTLGALVDTGRVVKVADGVVFDPAAYAEIERQVLALLERDGKITLAGFRDHFGTSRKYAQATLEYLDQRRITRRVGDERVRFAGPGAGQLVGGES